MISNVKLLETYNLARKDFVKHNDQKSIHWQKFYSGKKFDDENNLINFRKNLSLSKGLDDADNFDLSNRLYQTKLMELFSGDFLEKNLPKKNIGNSNYAVNYLGNFFDHGLIHPLKWFEELSRTVFKESKVICDIGAGYGALARIIINNYETKYIVIDLPEANLLSSFYLKEHFPNKKFFLYDDYKNLSGNSDVKISDSHIKENDIFILPPWTVNSFSKDIKIDFFVNTYSFMEMRYSIIQKYFDFIHKHSSDNCYFLNINR